MDDFNKQIDMVLESSLGEVRADVFDRIAMPPSRVGTVAAEPEPEPDDPDAEEEEEEAPLPSLEPDTFDVDAVEALLPTMSDDEREDFLARLSFDPATEMFSLPPEDEPTEEAEPTPAIPRPARPSTAKRTSGTTPLGHARDAAAAIGNLFRRNENVNENRKPADDLVEIVIDFEELKKQELNESFLAMFGGWVEQILKSMFGGRTLPLAVKGSSRDVKAFAKAIGGERAYLDAAQRYGLDHPTTYKNKAKLNNSIKGFEKDTGLKWPFK